MRRFPEIAMSVKEYFAKENLSIKEKSGQFTAVRGDQKFEQSINLSSKCSDGVIGHAKYKQYVTQWDLIYQEILGVNRLHGQYANVIRGTHENYTIMYLLKLLQITKLQIQGIMKFIEDKGSPLFSASSPVLQNFVTKEIMSLDIRNDLIGHDEKFLPAFKSGEAKYLVYRKERFLQKCTKISETIHRSILKTMKSIRDKPNKSIKKTVKQMNIAERNIEIARERGLTNNELLEYDVVPSSMLFDDDGMMTNPNKSLLPIEYS